jgi:DNA repair protein RecO (recombination protein O)
MEFSEQMLVLRVGRFKEADLWVRLLSPSRGMISAFAFGGARSRRRFVGCLDLFNEVQVRIRASRNACLVLEEGVLLAGPGRLRRDSSRLGIARNCADFLATLTLGPDGAGAAYKLFMGILQVLEEADILPPLLPRFFRLRMAADQGWDVDFERCAHCGNVLGGGGARFWVVSGSVRCPDCPPAEEGMGFSLRPESLETLRRIRRDAPVSWPGIELSPEAGRECGRAMDAFIQLHVGVGWESGRFCRV